MSAGLPLRLFQSDHFNVHSAVSYLRAYKDSVGITYYIAHKLAQVDEAELEFYWPQICHLVVSYDSESGALEALITKKCEESIHLAMLTLWQMQASLSDLAAKPGTASFAKCRRLFNRAQHIIFGDALLESTIEAHQKRRKLKLCRTKPAVVGMAVVLSAIGLPALAEFPGQMTLEEGRKPQNSNSGHIDQDVLHVSEAEDSDTDSYHDVVGPEKMGSSPSTREKQVTNAHRENETTLYQISGKSFKPTHASERGYAHGSASYLPGPPLPGVGNMPSEALNPRKSSLRNSMSARKASWTPALSSPSNTADRLGQSHSMVNLSKSSSLYRSATSPSAMQPEDWNRHVGDGEALSGDDTGSSYDANDTSPPHRVPDRSENHPASIYSQASRSAGYSTATGMSRKSPAARSAFVQSPIATPHLAASSTPSFHPYSKSANNLGDRQEDNANISLPAATLSLLLRSYACRSQLNLLTSLQDIATRLIVVPKLARLSALRAELTVLNHSLPRGCCLCLGCSGEGTGSLVSTDGDDGNKGPLTSTFKSIFSRSSSNKVKKRAHHRIVRISPSESVVLNSADRAPFLIHVEILEGDLDFDPSRRQNAEDVRSVLAERDGKISKSRSSGTDLLRPEHSASASVALGSIQAHTSAYAPVASERDSCNASPIGNTEITIGQSASNMQTASDRGDLQSPSENVEEEVDLVEQLYGSFSVHDVAALTTPEYHPEIHNRSVEERAWEQAERRKSLHSRQNSLESRPVPSTDTESGLPRQRQRKPMTIDDYAERMRMAAIMLAQLNASQQQPLSRTDAVTGAVGAGVGMGVNITYGVGSVVGSVFGVGIDVVRAGLGSRRRSSLDSANPPSVGQAGAGVAAPVDTSRAVTGFSSIVDNSSPTSLVTPLTSHQSQLHTQASTFSGSATPASHVPPRSRLLSPQDASTIRDRIMKEMMALEDERMARMKALTQSARIPILAANHTADSVEEETVVMRAINKEDPSGSVLSESWTEKKSRIRKGSPYGHLLSWDVFSVIVKTGADLRQEQLAVQLIKEFGRIWSESKSPHWIRFFRILVTSESTGLMETITDAVSVHSIKKEAYSRIASQDAAQAGYLPSYTLYDHFIAVFGSPEGARFRKAQDSFMKSLASYSIITYLLQIKDRHNGNILVDKDGHVMHIDFGFMLSNSPGSLGFEMAPFKLTQEYIDILGGLAGPKFLEYRSLLKRLFRDARQHAERIITLVELMQAESRLPCFNNGPATIQQLRDRFALSMSISQLDEHVDRLVLSSAGSAFTRLYDTFQRHSQGVL